MEGEVVQPAGKFIHWLSPKLLVHYVGRDRKGEVQPLFRRVSEARTVQLAEKNITLHVMPTEVNVAAEPALLEQALGNLLDNAIDFTPESGRITLSAEVDQEPIYNKF